jgi:hypothetical protein
MYRREDPGFEVVCDSGDGDKHQKAKIDRRRAAATGASLLWSANPFCVHTCGFLDEKGRTLGKT